MVIIVGYVMNWLDTKYVNLLSPRLERFKRVQQNFNFRCPICGDSKTNRTKARGWILSKGDRSRFYCHNCTASMRFPIFLKTIDPNLYYEYIKDTLLEKNGDKPKHPTHEFADKMKKPVFVKTTALNKLKKISQLDPDHPAKKYVESRSIPTTQHYRLFYAPKFKKWVNEILPDKFESLEHDEPRLIIPFLDQEKNMFGFQGRSFRKNTDLKYITIMLDESKPKMFGMDSIDSFKPVYIFEGPIDAMFIPNSLASAGGRIDSNLKLTFYSSDNIVIVYDNEPRNKETVQKIESAIDEGYKVCIWPESIQHKDVNDMVLAGISPVMINQMIDANTYQGLSAKLRIATWKKV